MESARARSRLGLLLAAAALSAAGLAACGDDPLQTEDRSDFSLDLVAYSTPRIVYEEALEPAFTATPEGQGVEFSNWFASSGDQSRAVENGFPADLVHLSAEPEITRLVDAGVVSPGYASEEPNGGVVQESVVALVMRKGNEKEIRGWEDLIREDVTVVTPNPFTSGLGRWNVIAAYGQAIGNGASEEEALEFVSLMLDNTILDGDPLQDPSAAGALDTFNRGYGDVLLTYESEAIAATRAGDAIRYVVPDDTIRIETIAVVPENAVNADQGEAFLDFLYSEQGQRAFAENGYRPVDPKVAREFRGEFPKPRDLFDIDDLGGWESVQAELFDPETGAIAGFERQLGVATE